MAEQHHAALDGLYEVSTPPDPLHYCTGIPRATSFFYDYPNTSSDEPIDTRITDYL